MLNYLICAINASKLSITSVVDFFLFLQTQDKRVYLYDNEWILIERSLKNTQRAETTGAGRE